MVRKLSLAIALALGITPFAAHSLGLGDIKTKSGLNQQFQADIELLSISNEEIGDIRASLASEEVFAKAGVTRPYFLSQLKFKPVLMSNGKGIIRVTSGEPVREPFLNFLVEVNWPKGRLFREYTVLLDPPATLPRRPAPVQAATTTSKIQSTRQVSPDNTVRGTAAGNGGITEYGPTRRNDTLWKIASEVRHSGASVEQMMMALFQANPQAFIKSNINNLKVGEILRVPERESVLSMTAREARIAFRDQVENWRSDRTPPAAAEPGSETGRPAAPAVDAVTKEAPVAEDKAAVPEAELKIARMRTAEEAGKSVADSVDQSGGSANLKEDLLEAREMRESALQESKELKSRVENLASQLEDLQRLLELKDDQLAKLQLALGEKPELPAEPTPDVPESSVPDTTSAPTLSERTTESPPEMTAAGEERAAPMLEKMGEKAAVDTPQAGGMADQAEPPTTVTVDEAPATESKMAATEMLPAPAETAAEPKPAVVTADEKIEVKPAPAAEPVPVQKPEAGFMEQLTNHPLLKKLTSDPMMLAIGGGVVAVLLALFWLLVGRRRKESQGFDEFQESILTDTVGEKEEIAVTDQAELTESDSGSTEETSFLSDFSPSEIDALPEETGEVDPMAEADVYIAYGRYGQAEELVRQGLERNPRNQELKLKLLEILYAMKNTAAFTALAQELKAAGVSKANPGAWASVATMGAKLDPGNSLYTADSVEAGKPELELEAKDEMNELNDLDLGDLAASLEFDDEPKKEQVDGHPAATSEPAQDAKLPESPDEDGLKFSLSDAAADEAVAMDNLGDELASLESALDLDLDKIDSDGLDLQKIAQEAVNLDESEGAALELPTLELESITSAAEAPGFSIEDIESLDLETEEIERLELPDVEELSADSLGEMVADADYSSDEINTKLDLARAYLDMGDEEGARSILQEVVNEGSEQQKAAAQKMMGGFS
ncbi:MAG: FimV family protein [Gammaproteobacteria bacterium]|nr:FimV family protein [Gammaproteobacteria bacterium]